MRWKIEVFRKILKSGCRVEDSRLRTAQRLANLIAVFCIVSWRVFWMTMLNRAAPNASPDLSLTATEIRLLDGVLADKPAMRRKTLSHYLTKIARLGDISRALPIHRRATPLSGADYPVSETSNSVLL
jgi:hypothetical protein